MLSPLKTKEERMIFIKLLIVEIEWKNAIHHTIPQTKKKESQREFL
jgi:hypothetical protein